MYEVVWKDSENPTVCLLLTFVDSALDVFYVFALYKCTFTYLLTYCYCKFLKHRLRMNYGNVQFWEQDTKCTMESTQRKVSCKTAAY